MIAGVPLLDRLVHDLKGPLAPLQTAAYLLGRDDLPAERRRELLDTLERQSRRLGQMIDEAGDWVRASEQRLVTRRDACELGLLLDTVVGGIAGCTVEPRVPAELVERVLDADEARLLQMLATLIRHASARDPGRVPELVAAAVPGGVQVTVSDRGSTLDPAALAALFEQPAPEPADGGLGLRLLIAAAIARAHGGTLVAMPGEGDRGLALVCELPCTTSGATAPP